MLRLVIFLAAVAAAAAGFSWLADRPGELLINWQGYQVQVSLFFAVVILALVLALTILSWSLLRGIWQSPAAIGNFFNRRREKRGLEALSSGMIAIGAGDKQLATRYAIQARKSLPNEPMTHLLRAQAARLAGDKGTTRRIFEAMLSAPDTEQLGLRGLFLEAEREGETEAARQFAERAVKLNPKLSWPVDALFDIQCREQNWRGALETLAVAKKSGHIEKPAADRRRAVLLTAQAQAAEDNDPERAQNLAVEAHGLAPDLIPAAAIAARLLSARGNTGKAVKIVQKTWKKAPHPELAVAYAYARLGDSPLDRLKRVEQLASLSPNVSESPIALANAAIEAKDFDLARKALQPLLESRLTQRVCTLMARIEGEQSGNTGAVREWLARAVNAPRDPAWTADGIVADDWAATSPVTGVLDAFSYRVPVETKEPRDKDLLAQKVEELVKLGVQPETMLAAGAGAVDAEDAAAPSPTHQPEGEVVAAVDKPNVADAVDAEVVDVTQPIKAPEPPAPSEEVAVSPEATAAESAAELKQVDVAPNDNSASTPKTAAVNGTNGTETSAKTASATPVVALVGAGNADAESDDGGERAKPSVSSASKAEPKIFVSPRPPDDPGLQNGNAKRR